ncbi:MAG: hypothetical protein RLT05_23825 [Bauldia litoralis]
MKLLSNAALAVAVTAILCAAPHAVACTKAEAQSKADAVSARLQQLVQQNPDRLKAVVPKVEKASQRLREALEKRTNDLDEICKYFDEVLADMN